VTLATVAWKGESPSLDSPEFDVFHDVRSDRKYLIAARGTGAGTTLKE